MSEENLCEASARLARKIWLPFMCFKKTSTDLLLHVVFSQYSWWKSGLVCVIRRWTMELFSLVSLCILLRVERVSWPEDFGLLLSFVLKEKLQQGWLINSNNDNYINNHHHCIYDHGHNIGTLILILIIKLINYPPWRPLLEVHSFPWASLSEYYSHLETDNVKYPCIFSR